LQGNTTDRVRLAERAEALRALHGGPELLVLPNAWDVASARVFEEAGFPAIATTSSGIAAAHGLSDGEGMPADEMLAAVARITAALGVPVTADLEAGYGLEPADLARRTIEAGAAGLNFEDSDHRGSGPLIDAARHAERIAALKESARAEGVDLVVNARVDVYLRDVDPTGDRLDEAVRRARAYREAGADCIFVPGVSDDGTIGALAGAVPAPLNVLAVRKTPPLSRLRELGVARVSLGGGPMKATLAALRNAALRLAADGEFAGLTAAPRG